MVAYSFKPQFVSALQAGDKAQTIRAKGKRRHAQVGDLVQIYTGMRTKHCRLLFQSPCIEASEITMKWLIGSQTKQFVVKVNGVALTPEQRHDLAIADGFANVDEFIEFFSPVSPFEGVLIKWQPIPW